MPFLIQIPFDDPVIIITLTLSILLIGPVFFERIRIPSIVGLLLSGALIGPHGFNLVSPDLEFSLLGTMGLLYLMFLAGLEIDLIDFIENKAKSIFMGIASFLVPFVLGFVISRYVLNYEILASWLIGAMLSSHTLISYPLMGKLGLISKPIVTIIVGATIIADVFALVAMELITNFAESGFHVDGLVLLFLHFMLFFFIVFLVIPKISKVFLTKYEGDLGVQYIFVLVMLFASALIAHLLKIEPILGAFFSGLVLNRLIMNTSPLYKRIEFIGNNLFIPFFLISIGILANFKVYLDQPVQIGFLIILLVTAIAGKYLAAQITRLVMKTTKTETNLVFGLSVSRAASAIAIILIGFNMGIIPEPVLNNTVIVILVTSMGSSYITQRAGKKLLFEGDNVKSNTIKTHQKLLVPIANPANMGNLLEFATLIKKADINIPVFTLTVYTKPEDVRENVDKNQVILKKVIGTLHTDIAFENNSRIDSSVTNGIARAAEEVVATSIIMGWNKQNTPFNILFGDVLNNLLDKTDRMLLVLKTPSSIKNVRRAHLFCTDNAQYEKGFSAWIETLIYLFKQLQIKATVHTESLLTHNALAQIIYKYEATKLFDFTEYPLGLGFDESIKRSDSDLLIFVNSRKQTVSYNRTFEHFMSNTMKYFTKNDILIIYPEQNK